MVADIDENLPQVMADLDWGLGSVWGAVKKVGGKVIAAAKSGLNWVKKKAYGIASKANKLIAKFGVMKKAKYIIDKFFKVTESPHFKYVFTKVVGKLVARFGAYYGITQGHVNAAYKLLTRPFWINQFWFFKWILKGRFRNDFMSDSYQSNKNFKRAGAACHDLRGTIGLAGKVLSLIGTPSIKAFGAGMGTVAKVMWVPCTTLK